MEHGIFGKCGHGRRLKVDAAHRVVGDVVFLKERAQEELIGDLGVHDGRPVNRCGYIQLLESEANYKVSEITETSKET